MAIPFLLLLLAATPFEAEQDKNQWQPYFTLHIENDSTFPGAGTDDSYTQGLDLRVNRESKKSWLSPLVEKVWNRIPGSQPKGDGVVDSTSLLIGQTIMTPHNVITYQPSRFDRPFAAYLYVGAEATRVRLHDRVSLPDAKEEWRLQPARLTMGLYGGVIGPVALGRDLQSGWHVRGGNRLVKGWHTQLDNEPQLNFRAAYDHIAARGAFLPNGVIKDLKVDLTLSEEIAIGTTQICAGAGATLRAGFGLGTFPGTTIGISAVRSESPKFGLGVQAGAKIRYMARNAFIEGTLYDPTDLDLNNKVTELSVGGELRWKEWRLTYLLIERSQEFSPVPGDLPTKHRFGAVNFSREPWGEGCDGQCIGTVGRILSGTRANLRFGRGSSVVRPYHPVDPDPSLAVNIGAEYNFRPVKWVGLAAAVEQAGIGREGGPPQGGVHSDLFLTALPITIGIEPTPQNSRHKVQLRLGKGLSRAQLQTAPDTGSLREPPTTEIPEKPERGRATLVGLRYSLQIAKPMSLVADVSRSRITSDETLVETATLTAFTFGFQLHPWGGRFCWKNCP